jgi:hypothetical protein
MTEEGSVGSEIAQEEALRLADALVSRELKETEARCGVLGQFVNDCERTGSRTSAWSEVVRELSSLHRHRSGLLRRHGLIQQALDCPVGDRPARVPLPASADPTVLRTQRQVQIQVQRRRRS